MTEIEIEQDELARRLGEVTVVDVRSPGEFEGSRGYPCDPRQGHLPGAISLPVDVLVGLDAAEVGARLGLAAGAEVVVYCHVGSRSELAAEVLRAHGFAARNYRGSWHEWSRSELPAEE